MDRLTCPGRDRPRVVITGLGALTPLGLTAADTWQGLLAGRSGIARITSLDLSDCPCQIGGELKGFDPGAYLGFKEARRMARFSQMAVIAAEMALADAGLEPERVDYVNAHSLETVKKSWPAPQRTPFSACPAVKGGGFSAAGPSRRAVGLHFRRGRKENK